MVKVIPIIDTIYDRIDDIPNIGKLINDLINNENTDTIIKDKDYLSYYLTEHEINSLLYSTYIFDYIISKTRNVVDDIENEYIYDKIVKQYINYFNIFSDYINYIEVGNRVQDFRYELNDCTRVSTTSKNIIYVRVTEEDASRMFSILKGVEPTRSTLVSLLGNYLNIVANNNGYMHNLTIGDNIDIDTLYLKLK